MSMFLSRIVLIPIRSAIAKHVPVKTLSQFALTGNNNFRCNNGLVLLSRQVACRGYSTDSIQPVVALENASSPVKKKIVYKKAVLEDVSKKEGHYLTLAYATANAYDLKNLKEALLQQKLYEPGK